jgi:glycosyltransferase involved in cell wall biosynthesis
MHIALNALFVHQELFGGGIYMQNLVRELSRIDAENRYTLYVSETGASHFQGLGPNFHLVYRNHRRPVRVLWEQSGLPIELRRLGVDVYHGPGYVVPLCKVCPQITTVHDLTAYLYPETHDFYSSWYYRLLMPWSVKAADRVIAVSDSAKADLIRLLGVPVEKICVIHHGKDERFTHHRDESSLAKLRTKYGITKKMILFVGGIDLRKNPSSLVRAFAMLKSLHKSHKLVLTGGFGEHYQSIRARLREWGVQDYVVFPGYVPDQELADFYRLAEVFVYPSLYEGFGLPVLEAMACGVPVITSNVSAMLEVAGDAAILVEPNNIKDLAGAIERVLADKALRDNLIEKGLLRSQRFSWKQAACETLDLYCKVAAHAG